MKYLGQRVKIKPCKSVDESWHGLVGVARNLPSQTQMDGDYEVLFDDGDTLIVKEFEVEPTKKRG